MSVNHCGEEIVDLSSFDKIVIGASIHYRNTVQNFLMQILWKPKRLAVFAGKMDYQKYKFWDRFMIRLIMWMTKGPTDPKAKIEFTNGRRIGIRC